MSFSSLIPDVISHILSFLTIRDHSRFSLTCKAYYEAFGITRIIRKGEAEVIEGVGAAEGRYENLANRYTVFLGDGSDDGVLRRIVKLNVKKYTGTTRHVKHLVIYGFYQYIHGDTIQYVPRCLTGEGLRYLVKLTINNNNGKCTISNVRFERLVALRADRCSIIGCQFDELEFLEIWDTQFLSEMPVTIKTLRVRWCQFSDDCVRGSLVNLVNINSAGHDFIRYAPNVKEAVVRETVLYNLPESLEYLNLVDVRVQGEKFYLPNLRYLRIERLPFDYTNGMYLLGHIIAPRLSELTARNTEISALDCPPVLDVCNTFNMRRNIDINSVVLFTDHAVDPKKYPSMRALYFHVSPWDLGDFVYELDMVYIDHVTAKTSKNINTRVLITLEIFKDADLSKMSRLKLVITRACCAAMVPASVKFIKYEYEQHEGELKFIKLFRELFPDSPSITHRVV